MARFDEAAEPDERSLLDQIHRQRDGCEAAGSPLYRAILDGIGAQVLAGGPAATILRPWAGEALGSAVLLRFLAGMHALVLAGDAPALARHYPSVGGNPGSGLLDDFSAAVEDHQDALTEAMHQPVQTNEPGRSAALLCGIAEVAALGRPLRILELGASAGLNLWFDRYRYTSGDASWGSPDARLCFEDAYRGPAPLEFETVVADRRGCDLLPIDVRTTNGARRLRSLVWPDQGERLARLDAAIATVRDLPHLVDQAGALDWLVAQLQEPAPGVTTVVMHSIVLQYLPTADRRQLVERIEQAGRSAPPDAPVAWLRTEPGGSVAETRLTVWPDGVPRVLATSGFHGPPIEVR